MKWNVHYSCKTFSMPRCHLVQYETHIIHIYHRAFWAIRVLSYCHKKQAFNTFKTLHQMIYTSCMFFFGEALFIKRTTSFLRSRVRSPPATNIICIRLRCHGNYLKLLIKKRDSVWSDLKCQFGEFPPLTG